MQQLQSLKKNDIVRGLGYLAAATITVRLLNSLLGKKKTPKPRERSSSIGTTKLFVSKSTPEDVDYDAVIGVLAGFETPLDVEKLKALFGEEMRNYRNFRCVPEQNKFDGPVIWREVPYDANDHFFFHTVKDTTALKEEVHKVVNDTTSFRHKKVPWWNVHLYGHSEGKYHYMLVRIHHAIGDGVSLTEAFGDIMMKADGSPANLTEAFSPKLRSALHAQKSFSARLKRLVRFPLTFVQSVAAAVNVLTWAAGKYDTQTSFHKSKESVYTDKVPVYLPSHSLALVKKIKDKLNAQLKTPLPITLNDLEFSLFAGMIHRYVEAHGEQTTYALCRALTPFAIPEIADPMTRYDTLLRNHWTFMSNKLPVDEKTALDRLKASNKYWSYTKTSMIVPMAFALHKLAAGGPLALRRDTSHQLCRRHSVVFSNVPGPAEDVFIAGSQMKTIHMLFPNHTVQTGIISLAGYIHFVFLDNGPFSGAREKEFGDHFTAELVELAAAAGISKEEVLAGLKPAFIG